MKTKKIRDILVPAIGQGVGGSGSCEDAYWIKVLREGIDLGMSLIDTAEVYRSGRSEEIVGKSIAGIRKKVFVSTKFSPEHSRYPDVVKSLEGSLRRLRTDYVDLYQIHWPNSSVPMEEIFKAMKDLKADGKIRHIGVSNFTIDDFIMAQSISGYQIESNQIEYNLVDRGIEERLLPYSIVQKCMLIAYNPLLYSNSKIGVLKDIAMRYEKTIAQVVLRWLIGHETVVAIPKTLNLDHLRENASASEFDLEEEDCVLIDRFFKSTIIPVRIDDIRVLSSDCEVVYTTLEDAIANKENAKPSPKEIAEDILDNRFLKPVRLIYSTDSSGKYRYDLTQGRMRYWAWIIAFGKEKPIPAYIME